jgi:hypothetical protein
MCSQTHPHVAIALQLPARRPAHVLTAEELGQYHCLALYVFRSEAISTLATLIRLSLRFVAPFIMFVVGSSTDVSELSLPWRRTVQMLKQQREFLDSPKQANISQTEKRAELTLLLAIWECCHPVLSETQNHFLISYIRIVV